MLLKTIYIMSLEHPGPGFLGRLGAVGASTVSLIAIKNYVIGYAECATEHDLEDVMDSWGDFVGWLRENGHFPCRGWAQKIIDEYGDGEMALNRFVELMYEYLKLHKPSWFIEFNSKEQPSPWKNVSGPRSSDIRNREHISWAMNT
jgi:hypothetical protein